MALLPGSPPGACDHVWLDAARSDAAWRVALAAHVFGRRESLGRAARPGRMLCVHTGTKQVFGHFAETTSSRGYACKGDVSLLRRLRSSKPRDGEVKWFIFSPAPWRLNISSSNGCGRVEQQRWRRPLRSRRSLLANTKTETYNKYYKLAEAGLSR